MSPLAGLLDLDGRAAETGWLEETLGEGRPGGRAKLRVRGTAALGVSGRAQLWVDADSELWVAADARLDDRAALLDALPHGARAEAGCAELIAAAYRAWGEECYERLVGPFAFVVWDAVERRLLAARDPMGSRSLHYSLDPGRRLLLASNARQLVGAFRVRAELDPRMVAAHLAGLPGQHDWSYFADVTQLAPAHVLSLGEGGGPRLRRYWEIDPGRRLSVADEAGYDDAFRSVLQEAVRCRLAGAERPALHLSGGLDSGAIAGMAAGLLAPPSQGPPLMAISWAFGDLPECDERRRSDEVVRRHALRPEYVPADSHWLWSDFATAPPADDPAVVICPPLLRASLRHARGLGADLVLGGGGGNAVVGGRLPNLFEGLAAGRWGALGRDLRALHRREKTPWPRLLWRYLGRPLVKGGAPATEVAWPQWVSDSLRGGVGLAELAGGTSAGRLQPHSRALRHDVVTSPAETRALLAERRMAENAGVRYRLPFRDVRLFELAMALPVEQFWRAGEEKVILRRALADVVPPEVREGGSAGTLGPLRTRGLRDREAPRVADWLRDPLIAQAGWVEPEPLRRAYDAYRTQGAPEFPMSLALELEAWLRQLSGAGASVSAEDSR